MTPEQLQSKIVSPDYLKEYIFSGGRSDIRMVIAHDAAQREIILQQAREIAELRTARDIAEAKMHSAYELGRSDAAMGKKESNA